MRSTLIFHGITESEQSDAWEDVSKNLVNLLAHKLDLDHYQLGLQLSRAYPITKSDFDKDCRPIYDQLINWRYMYNIRRRLIALYKARSQSNANFFSKTLTNRRNNALVRRKDILKESPDLQIHLEFPAKLMGKKRYSCDRYELLGEF